MAVNHGAISTTDAMTDPRPRVTNTIGNAQHTSVVSVVVNPTSVLRRSVRISPLQGAVRSPTVEIVTSLTFLCCPLPGVRDVVRSGDWFPLCSGEQLSQ